MANFTDFFDKKGFSGFYSAMNADTSNYESVYNALSSRRMTDRKRAEVAESILTQVSAYEYAKQNVLNGESKQIFDNFMAGIETLEPTEKTKILLELDFGLDVYQNPDLTERIKEGAEIPALFEEYYGEFYKSGNPDTARLKDRVYDKLSNFSLSPKAMQLFTENLRNSNVCVTCAAVSEQTERFKAELAARIFASDENMTVEQAVYTACTLSDSQAIADAVGEGIVAKEKAQRIIANIICVATIVSIVAGILYLGGGLLAIATEGAVAGVAGTVSFVSLNVMAATSVFMMVAYPLAEFVADGIGSFVAKRHFVKHLKDTKLIEGLQAIGTYDGIETDVDTTSVYEYEYEDNNDCDYDYLRTDNTMRVKA